MMKKKTAYILIIIIVALAFTTVGCERSYSDTEGEGESQATPTLFPDTIPAGDINALATAGAQTATAMALTSGAPTLITTPAIPGTPNTPISGTPAAPGQPSATSPAAPVAPPTSSVGVPATYALEQGEFPYCIARRFDIDPSELLNHNNLSNAQARALQPGLVLSIPQGGKAFPSTRALNAHPTSYTVPSPMSVYAVACYFGDLDPSAITSANPNITDPNNIATGTILTIP